MRSFLLFERIERDSECCSRLEQRTEIQRSSKSHHSEKERRSKWNISLNNESLRWQHLNGLESVFTNRILFEDLKEKVVLLLPFFGIDEKHQHQQVNDWLKRTILCRSLQIYSIIPCLKAVVPVVDISVSMSMSSVANLVLNVILSLDSLI